MQRILHWWWPIYTLLYAVVIWPNGFVDKNYLLRMILTAVAVVGGLILELHVHGVPKRTQLPRLIAQHPVLILALCYGLWAVISSLLSPNTALSLTGTILDYSDGALWTLGVSFVLILVYIRVRRDPTLAAHLAAAILLSGTAIAIMALIEFFSKQALFYSGTKPWGLPVVWFPGPGQLVGFLVLTGSFGIGWWFHTTKTPNWIRAGWWSSTLLLSLALAVTNRRTAIPALVLSLLGGVRQPKKLVVIGLALVIGLVGGRMLLDQIDRSPDATAFDNTNTLTTRSYLWKAAFKGIQARPLTGWGGGQFQFHWHEFLIPDEVVQYMRHEYAGAKIKQLERVFSTPGGDQLFLFRTETGQLFPLTYNFWKAHNQWLDVGVMWGLIGLALYFMLALLTLRNFYLPGVVALACYQVYLILWYAPLGVEGILFLVTGFSLAMGYKPFLRSSASLRPKQMASLGSGSS
jgi:O-antigen ligase